MTFTFKRAAAVALLSAATLAGTTAPSQAAEPTTCEEVVVALEKDQKRVSTANAAVRRDSAAVTKAKSAARKARTTAGKRKTRAARTAAEKKLKTSKARQAAAKKTLQRHRELSAELCTPGY